MHIWDCGKIQAMYPKLQISSGANVQLSDYSPYSTHGFHIGNQCGWVLLAHTLTICSQTSGKECDAKDGHRVTEKILHDA